MRSNPKPTLVLDSLRYFLWTLEFEMFGLQAWELFNSSMSGSSKATGWSRGDIPSSLLYLLCYIFGLVFYVFNNYNSCNYPHNFPEDLILLFIWSTHKTLESSFARADFLEPFRDGRVLGLDVNGKLGDKFHPANETQIGNGVFPSSKISLVLGLREMCLQHAENTFDFIHISIDGGGDFLLVIERKPIDSAFGLF